MVDLYQNEGLGATVSCCAVRYGLQASKDEGGKRSTRQNHPEDIHLEPEGGEGRASEEDGGNDHETAEANCTVTATKRPMKEARAPRKARRKVAECWRRSK